MSSLPRVGGLTRERLARELDDRGPEVCRTEITLDLEANNPELLDMAARCARDIGDFTRLMTGFCIFYRLLTAEAHTARGTSPDLGDKQQLTLLPRVVGGEDEALVEHVGSAGEIARHALRLAHDQDAGGDVPGAQIVLPERVEASRSDIGQIERGRSRGGAIFS